MPNKIQQQIYETQAGPGTQAAIIPSCWLLSAAGTTNNRYLDCSP